MRVSAFVAGRRTVLAHEGCGFETSHLGPTGFRVCEFGFNWGLRVGKL